MDVTPNHRVNLMAGTMAGILELCLMYPLDTVKTRMQSLNADESRQNIRTVFWKMVKEEGAFRPVRGMSVIAGVAGPAHALYFASYEFVKYHLKAGKYAAYGIAGAVATVVHDAIVNPAEVIKQRLQMANSPYKGVSDCARRIYVEEGLSAFYRSYGTQLAMNAPFQMVQFVTYEIMQNLTNTEREYSPMAHIINGGIAGGFAAAVTTPLDVCKTLINTQEKQVPGMAAAARTIYKSSGVNGFFLGIVPRVLQQMPSNAICWSVYETFKHFLT